MREDCTQSLCAEFRTVLMDERSVVIAGAALIVALLAVGYFIRWLRLRDTKRRMEECLPGYFNGDLPLDRLTKLAREIAGRGFTGSPECQALVQVAFHRAAEAKLAGKAHSLQIEKQLLAALAGVKSEFGLPDRYRSEGWRAGRE
jgi:hypothetical protein